MPYLRYHHLAKLKRCQPQGEDRKADCLKAHRRLSLSLKIREKRGPRSQIQKQRLFPVPSRFATGLFSCSLRCSELRALCALRKMQPTGSGSPQTTQHPGCESPGLAVESIPRTQAQPSKSCLTGLRGRTQAQVQGPQEMLAC